MDHVAASTRPNEPEYVTIYFRKGVPQRINGEAKGPVGLLKH